MRQRAISAVFFVIAMLGGVFGGPSTFYILFAIITGGCLWELIKLLGGGESRYLLFRQAAAVVLGVLPFLLYGSHMLNLPFAPGGWTNIDGATGHIAGPYVPLVFLAMTLGCLLIAELFMASTQPFNHIAHYLLGLSYIGLPMALLVAIACIDGSYEPMRVLGLLLLCWANDTMAYLIGSRIGKTPFFARISPKKTWEGTLGGMACTFLFAYLLSLGIDAFDLKAWMGLAACAAVFGTVGDLVESMLKRSVGVKDSGAIMPGHGGFLDRFDSFIFVLPFAWFVLSFIAS